MDADVICIVADRPHGINFIGLDDAEARVKLAPLVQMDKVNHSGLCDIADFIGNGKAFMAYQGGQELALVVINKVERALGRELEIRAALSVCDRPDLVEKVLPALEWAFGWDCQQMTVYTKRAGLVRKLEKIGYQEAAKIMRKAITQ